MQVTQLTDHVSHAILGGGHTIAMEMSDSAEFFAILYKSLYSDEKLAVVRETLCNAWDAHIEAGCTGTPLEIILNANELIIRDFGKGIPRALIGPIYGVMGGSTKEANVLVTGGFGLGCKAPFAYGDHFEVTSWSQVDGLMTVYQMSKSNAEKKGKPGITPILSVPITDGSHGLQVKIPLKQGDLFNFRNLITRIARNGEILANVNGSPEGTIPFSKMKHDWLLTKDSVTTTADRILLRYGNVIYPIDYSDEYRDQMGAITSVLGRLNKASGKNWSIIFQAKPNTVSVTPSRESLSMQEHTVETIKGLLTSFCDGCDAHLPSLTDELIKESIERAGKSTNKAPIFDITEKIPGLAEFNFDKANYLADYIEFVSGYLIGNKNRSVDIRKKDYTARLNALMENKFGDTALLLSYKNEIANYVNDQQASGWFKNEIKNPLIKALENATDVWPAKMYTLTKRHSDWSDTILEPIQTANCNMLFEALPYLRKIVVLAYNRADAIYRPLAFPIIINQLGPITRSFVYLVPRSARQIEAAKAFFLKNNFTIIDLTIWHPWEDKPEKAVTAKAARPVRVGLPVLSCIQEKNFIDTKIAQSTDNKLITNPEFVFKISAKNSLDALPGFTKEQSQFIINKWGTKGGIVINAAQHNKYVRDGAKSFPDFLLEILLDKFTNNNRIKESLPFDYLRFFRNNHSARRQDNFKNLFVAIYSDPEMIKHFGLTWTMDPEEKMYFDLYNTTTGMPEFGDIPVATKIRELIKTIPNDPKVMIAYNRLINRRAALEIFDIMRLCETIIYSPKTPDGQKLRAVARDAFLHVLEG